MRKLYLLVGLLCAAPTVFAQTTQKAPFVKKRGVMLNFIFNDFQTPRNVKASSLTSAINNSQVLNFRQMLPGIGVSYLENLSTYLDFTSSLGVSTGKYLYKNHPAPTSDHFLVEADANLNLRLLPDNYVINPYFTAGAGASYYAIHFGAYVPVGAGINVKLGDMEFMRIQAQYRFGITERTGDHVNLSLGFGSFVNNPAPALKPVPPAPVEKDTDGDGIVDSKDQCPDVKGVAQYNGCPVPDSDNDGLTDDVDKCPTVAGLAKYNGCPIPDTDGDKINDEEDKCPTEAGVARLQGCPEKDTDGDGVMDDLDRCPTVAGPASNNGCPVPPPAEEVKKVKEAARQIYFETGSAKLKATSTPALTRVISVLKNNPGSRITIEGHTDNVGSAELNKKLSEDRAASVKNYLVDKGIDESRITSAGFGFDRPVAPNTTAAGRAKNRRVEMILE